MIKFHKRSDHNDDVPIGTKTLVQCKICHRLICVLERKTESTHTRKYNWMIFHEWTDRRMTADDTQGLNHYERHGNDESRHWLFKKSIWYGLRDKDI